MKSTSGDVDRAEMSVEGKGIGAGLTWLVHAVGVWAAVVSSNIQDKGPRGMFAFFVAFSMQGYKPGGRKLNIYTADYT